MIWATNSAAGSLSITSTVEAASAVEAVPVAAVKDARARARAHANKYEFSGFRVAAAALKLSCVLASIVPHPELSRNLISRPPSLVFPSVLRLLDLAGATTILVSCL
jgi:hypothetical protein